MRSEVSEEEVRTILFCLKKRQRFEYYPEGVEDTVYYKEAIETIEKQIPVVETRGLE